MTMAEQLEDTLGAEIAAIIKEEIAPLRKRMDDFEARGIPEYVAFGKSSANIRAATL
jgi:hypothetical protein